jgi:hypothetical protein
MLRLPRRLCGVALIVAVCLSQSPWSSAAGEVTTSPSGSQCCNAITGVCTVATEHVATPEGNGDAIAAPMQRSVDLDLSSTARTLSVCEGLLQSTVDIRVGGNRRAIAPGAAVTPAELLAVHQVLTTGSQSIKIGGKGNAIGGTFFLSSLLASQLADLVVPQGVTAIYDAAASPLALEGELRNAGNLFSISSDAAVTTANISASSLINQKGAVLASALPGRLGALLGNSASSLSLNLTAIHDIINAGVIKSSGSLTATAGGSIVNAPGSGASSSSPVMQAVGDAHLQSARIINSGVVEALGGSINLVAQTGRDIAIDNAGGALQALNGEINVGPAPGAQTASIAIMGGDLLAGRINLGAGSGRVVVDVDRLTGTLNTSAAYAHIGASTPVLTLGEVNVAGDPTYYNDAGSVQLAGNIQVDESLAILASQDVTTTSAVSLIQARDAGGQGHNIHIVAGASLTGDGSPADRTSTVGDTPPVAGNATGYVTVNGASSSGGNIDFTATPNLLMDTRSTCSNCESGDVVMVAYAQGTAGGRILLPDRTSSSALGSEINVSGGGTFENGNVTLIAGATSGTAITTGKITVSEVQLTGGLITLTVAQPAFSSGGSLTFAADGSISSGNSFVAGSTIENAAVQVTGALTSQVVSITAGGNITVDGDINAQVVRIIVPSGGPGGIELGANVSGPQELILSTGGSGSITQTAGIVTAGLSSIGSFGGNIGSSGAAIRLTGNIVLTARAQAGNVFLKFLSPCALEESSAGGVLNISGDGAIMLLGNLSAGFVTVTVPSLDTSGHQVEALGTINIASPLRRGLAFFGGGSFIAPGGITFTASVPNLAFNAGSSAFMMDGPTTWNAVGGQVTVLNTVDTTGNLTINTCTLFEEAPLTVAGTRTVNIGPDCPSGGGTIINTSGDIVLTNDLVINSFGANLAIISSGNIIGDRGLTTINLSSTTTNSGSLYMIAGFKSTPGSSATEKDTSTLFTLTGPSDSGGSVNLRRVAINTSSRAPGLNAGDVTVLASSGSANAGAIVIGRIDARSKAGKGGSVALIAEGGVQVSGTINTSGATGGGSVTLGGGRPQIRGGQLLFQNGTRGGSGEFAVSLASTPGAPIAIGGSVTTTSSQGSGGPVSLSTNSSIDLKGSIRTSGLVGDGVPAGGDVNFKALSSGITINGSITTSAFAAVNLPLGQAGGDAGDISVSTGAFLFVKNGVIARGGSANGLGDGGAGGAVSINTARTGGTVGPFIGVVDIGGIVDARGGNANSAAGGAGGRLTVNAAVLRVRGASGGASINTSAGVGENRVPGTSGSAAIKTFGVQGLPADLDLISKKHSEFALPGGLFSVGDAEVNGTAGRIVNGASQATKTNAWHIVSTSPFDEGGTAIMVEGGSATIIEGSGAVDVDAVNGAGKRTRVTPGEALALFQVSRSQAQTVGLNLFGQVVGVNPQTNDSPSKFSATEVDLARPFTVFRLATADTGSLIRMDIHGGIAVLNLSRAKSVRVGGQLNFVTDDGQAWIDRGKSPVVVAPTGSITGTLTTTLVISSTLQNHGNIRVGEILALNPHGTLAVINASGATIRRTDSESLNIIVPSGSPPGSLTVRNDGGSLDAAVLFQVRQVSLLYKDLDTLPSTAPAPAVELALALAGPGGVPEAGTVMGALAGSVIDIRAARHPIFGTGTSLQLVSNISLNATKALKIHSAGGLTIPGIADLFSAGTMSVASTGDFTWISPDSSLNRIAATKSVSVVSRAGQVSMTNPVIQSDEGSILVSGRTGVQLTGSGSTKVFTETKDVIVSSRSGLVDVGVPFLEATGSLQISTAGAIILRSGSEISGRVMIVSSGTRSSAGGLTIESDVSLGGDDIRAVVAGGGISIGDNVQFEADAGNIVLLASGPIQGGQGNSFMASAAGTSSANSKGGGIEIGSGLTRGSQLPAAFRLPGGTAPSAGSLGDNVVINNGGNMLGVVLANTSGGGTIDLTTPGSTGATLNLNRGAIVFDAIGPGASVQLDGGTFSVQAFKPVAFGAAIVMPEAENEEWTVDTGDAADESPAAWDSLVSSP